VSTFPGVSNIPGLRDHAKELFVNVIGTARFAAGIALCVVTAACSADRAVGTTPLDGKIPLGATVPVTRITLAAGDSIKLIPVDKIANSRGVSWSSSNTAIVRVSTSGWAWGVAVGTATVTAKAKSTTQQWIVDVTPSASSPPPSSPPTAGLGLNADLGQRLFPADNAWNQPVDTAQVDPNSAAIINSIGATKAFHPDFGANWNGGPFGIPYIVVSGTQAKVGVAFQYASESDPGPYPIPPNPPIEGGPSSTGDRHILIVDRDNWKLYELFAAYPNADGSWRAGSGAIFDLSSNALRPAGWTSADAAGLPILPGLVRYKEVRNGEIAHALRFTVSRTRRAYIAPARHWASSDTSSLRPPMGMRVRLKAGFDISSYPASAQVILRAMKKYGMIVADNGSDWYVSGTADARWNDAEMNTLKKLRGSDFEVVKMGTVVKP
jgi:hypothetical protein